MNVSTPTTVRSEVRLTGQRLHGLIERAITHANILGQEFADECEKLSELKNRLGEERFHLAVLGQFKRGKSTLINALLGERILPSAVIPLTAIPTFVRAGSEKGARIFFANERADEIYRAKNGEELSAFIAKFVAESENPKNYLEVSHVEVFHPSELLKQGVVLIDTPGIGSTFRHNTEVTLNFLSQCDAALFVTSADPPITEVEVLFLKEVRNKVEHLIFLVNKADYLDETEKQQAMEFFRSVLRDEAGFIGELPIFCVSARQGLEAKQRGDEIKWRQSGLEEFEKYLIDFLVHEKTSILNNALAKKTKDVMADMVMRLQLIIQSLQMPLAELDERRQALGEKLEEIERQRIMAEDLLEGDRRRTLKYLEVQAENLRRKAREQLSRIVREQCAVSADGIPDQTTLETAVAIVVPEIFERELGDMSQTFDRYVTEVLRPHQQRAENLIGEIRRAAAELFAIPCHAPAADVFQMKRKPYWIVHKWPSSLNAIPVEWIDKLLPRSLRHSRIMKRWEEQVEALVCHNVENLRWGTLQNLNDTFYLFTSGLKKQLHLTLSATQGAIQAAWEKRQNQSDTVDGEIKKLEEVLAQLAEIESNLTVG